MEGFSAPSINDTPVSLSWCGEGGFQVTLGAHVGYHHKTFKELIIIGVYPEGGHYSVHVVIRIFLGSEICMCLADLGPVRALVGEVAKLLEFEALDLSMVPGLPLAIIGVHLATVRIIVIILRKNGGAGGCM